VPQIVARVFGVNLLLAELALITVVTDRTYISLMALIAGAGLVSVLLVVFSRGKS
jgi:hypothetical protein